MATEVIASVVNAAVNEIVSNDAATTLVAGKVKIPHDPQLTPTSTARQMSYRHWPKHLATRTYYPLELSA